MYYMRYNYIWELPRGKIYYTLLYCTIQTSFRKEGYIVDVVNIHFDPLSRSEGTITLSTYSV